MIENLTIFTIKLHNEQDVVPARQSARRIAALLGFDNQDQTRLATAVSEVVRETVQLDGGVRVTFSLENRSMPQVLQVSIQVQESVARRGAVPFEFAAHPALAAAERLVDRCQVEQSNTGFALTLGKLLPKSAPYVHERRRREIAQQLAREPYHNPVEEIQRQNQELIQTLEALRERQEAMAQLNRELEDTNRGVVALYAELDEKAEHLRRANETKSRFLSHMSHEFRTPLNSILALTRLLLDRMDGELTDEQETQVKFIRKAATDLSELVSDLLDLAKIEAGKIAVRPSEFTVNSLFSALRGMMRPLLVDRAVELIFDPTSDDIPPLYTDENKVSQILRNFLSNAMKFTEQGEVRVCAELSADGQSITFGVSDTGIGIPTEQQAAIFTEFIQVENPLQTQVKGTGLGLPLCRKLAELLGGTVTMESALGVGSTFRVTIPHTYSTDGPQWNDEAATTIQAGTTEPLLLIIEDNEEMRYLFRKLLARTPYQLQEATDGVTGLKQARAAQPQMICLDLMLPGLDGFQVLEELKADPTTEAIPILVVTSKTLTEEERQRVTAHAPVLSKTDLSQTALLTALEEARAW